MAILDSNSPLNGARGRFGNLILRRCGDRTLVYLAPEPSAKPPSARQRVTGQRFGRAGSYASHVCANPAQRHAYARLDSVLTVRELAVRDHLHAPEVTRIIDAEYEGNQGNLIRVYATDDTKVAAVNVTIRDATGKVFERGRARDVRFYWAYRAKTSVPPGTKVTIEATARDLAGNRAVLGKEVEI